MSGGGGGSVRENLPVNRMTHRRKNITLPQTSFADGKKMVISYTVISLYQIFTNQ